MSENQIETIAVTGATGFIGRALTERLVSQGFRVRALVRPRKRGRKRSRQRCAFAPESGVEVVEGDLGEEHALERLVAGTRALVHCAARVRDTPGGYRDTNVEGTRRLARVAARQSTAPHIVLLSSLAAREPEISPYAASKRAAESALFEEAAGMRITVLRPCAVYGPGDRELLGLFTCMARGIAPVLGPRGARFSLLFVEDLSACITHLVRSEDALGRILEVHDGKVGGYGWDDVAGVIAGLSGRRQRRVRIPGPLATSVAAANLVTRRLFGSASMFTPGKVRELRHADWVCDDSALVAATSWRPQVRLEEGLRRTLSLPARATL